MKIPYRIKCCVATNLEHLLNCVSELRLPRITQHINISRRMLQSSDLEKLTNKKPIWFLRVQNSMIMIG